MKTLSLFILFFVFTFINYGQYIPVNSSFSTPRGTINTVNHIRMPMYNNYSSLSKLELRYTIILKNDSVFSVPSTITLTDSTHFLTYTKKGLEKKSLKINIYPNQTKQLRIKTSEGFFVGEPRDSCWLFKTVNGRINGYSYLPIVAGEEIKAIQKNTSEEIVTLTKPVLLLMVNDHEKATALANKGKLWQAIKAYNNLK